MSEHADKMHDSKNGGLSAEGRKKFKEKDGSNLKPGVKSYDSASLADKKRWISWASRFAGNPQPLKKDNGEPTNYALMFKAWGEKVPTSDADVKAVYNKAQRRKKALGMGEKSMDAQDQAAAAELAAADPSDKKLWNEVVAEAKKKFKVYPSFYANAWVTNTYKKRGGKFNGKKDSSDKPAFLKSEAVKMLAAVTDQRDGQVVGDYVWVEWADRWQGVGRFFPLLPMVTSEEIARHRAAEEETPDDGDTVDGQVVTSEDKTQLTALRDSHQKSRTAAKSLLDASHPLAVAIGADADAFIGTQLDSIARLIGPVDDFDEPRDYSDTMREEQAGEKATVDQRAPLELTHPQGSWTTARPGDFGTITINGQPYHLSQQLNTASHSGGGNVVIHNTVSPNELRARVTEHMDRLKVKKPTDLDAADVPRARAFVTQAHGRTVVTGPAAAFTGGWQKALSANEHMLWIQGRLVGGETPNRNGALWTAGDLEMGQPTVAHGPLNWLHEARHVIGSIADSRFLPAKAKSGNEQAAETTDPHIIAAAGIWNWLYPDEAMVVQQASDLGQLWYSMECISKDVICSGENGCGHTMDYMAFARDEPGACQHMQERAKGGTTLRFAEPTFLGAAVIVPPTRPGWADADASVMAEAASLSEKAFEQTGKPDIPTSVFEQMVAQVVKYTQM